jgi:hypothetical protein
MASARVLTSVVRLTAVRRCVVLTVPGAGGCAGRAVVAAVRGLVGG